MRADTFESTAEPQPPQLDPEEHPPLVHLTFWQKPLVQDLVPFLTSVTFHVGLLIIGALLFAAGTIIIKQPLREQVIIPEAAIIDHGAVGGIPNPGLGGDPNLSAGQNVDPTVTVADGWATRRSETLTATLMGGNAPDAADSVIGLGVHSGIAGTGKEGIGGAGGEGGGPMAPFGVPGGGMAMGPKSPFMGISGNARRVVYICDGSGSMMDVFWRVRAELKKAVDVLRPLQAFNVIFFSDVDVAALNKTSLVMATPDNKRKAFELSETMAAAGSTDPLPAIRMAFEQKPELSYVLTDGFENAVSYDAVIEQFRRLNPDKKVRVNTILIRSTANPELEKVVRTIASENGGICKIIDRQDI
jgi:hypothetical protein